MKKLLKKLSVMRLEERVLFDAAAAAAAVEADNQAQQNEELQQQQQQLQEQLAAEEAAQQAQAQAEAAAEAAEQAEAAAQESENAEADAAGAAENNGQENVNAGSEVSAAVEAIAADEGVEVEADGEESEKTAEDVVGEALEGLNGVEVEANAETEEVEIPVAENTETEETEVLALTPEEVAASIANGTRHELVIVSDSVKDAKVIIDGLAEGTEVLVLDRESDVLDQINEYLDNSTVKYDAIHVVSHGGDGYLVLNNSVIDMESLQADPASWAAIGEHVAEDGDIMLYGCNIAQTENGKAFASQLASLTGADIAASIDVTGGTYGWELEYVTNAVATPVLSFNGYNARLESFTVAVNANGEYDTAAYANSDTVQYGVVANTTLIKYTGTTTDGVFTSTKEEVVGGTLAWAITQANNTAGEDSIVVQITGDLGNAGAVSEGFSITMGATNSATFGNINLSDGDVTISGGSVTTGTITVTGVGSSVEISGNNSVKTGAITLGAGNTFTVSNVNATTGTAVSTGAIDAGENASVSFSNIANEGTGTAVSTGALSVGDQGRISFSSIEGNSTGVSITGSINADEGVSVSFTDVAVKGSGNAVNIGFAITINEGTSLSFTNITAEGSGDAVHINGAIRARETDVSFTTITAESGTAVNVLGEMEVNSLTIKNVVSDSSYAINLNGYKLDALGDVTLSGVEGDVNFGNLTLGKGVSYKADISGGTVIMGNITVNSGSFDLNGAVDSLQFGSVAVTDGSFSVVNKVSGGENAVAADVSFTGAVTVTDSKFSVEVTGNVVDGDAVEGSITFGGAFTVSAVEGNSSVTLKVTDMGEGPEYTQDDRILGNTAGTTESRIIFSKDVTLGGEGSTGSVTADLSAVYVGFNGNVAVGAGKGVTTLTVSDFGQVKFAANKTFSIGESGPDASNKDTVTFTAIDRGGFNEERKVGYFGDKYRVEVGNLDIGRGAVLSINNLMMEIRGTSVTHYGHIEGAGSELTFRDTVSKLNGVGYDGGTVHLDSVRYENGLTRVDGGSIYRGHYGDLGLYLAGNANSAKSYTIAVNLFELVDIDKVTFINRNDDAANFTGSFANVTMSGRFSEHISGDAAVTMDFEVGSKVNVIYNSTSQQYIFGGNYYELTVTNTAEKILAGAITVGVSAPQLKALQKDIYDTNNDTDLKILARKMEHLYRGGISLGTTLKTQGNTVDFYGYTYAATDKALIDAGSDTAESNRVSYHVAHNLVNIPSLAWGMGIGLNGVSHENGGVGPNNVTGNVRDNELYKAFFGGTYQYLSIDTMPSLPVFSGVELLGQDRVTFNVDVDATVNGVFWVQSLKEGNETSHHHLQVNVDSTMTFNNAGLKVTDASIHFNGGVLGNISGIEATRDNTFGNSGLLETNAQASEFIGELRVTFDSNLANIGTITTDGIALLFNGDVQRVGSIDVYGGQSNAEHAKITFNGDVSILHHINTHTEYDAAKPVLTFNGETTGSAKVDSYRGEFYFNYDGDQEIFEGVYDDFSISGTGEKVVRGNTVIKGVFNGNETAITISENKRFEVSTLYNHVDPADPHTPQFTVESGATLQFGNANTLGMDFHGSIISSGNIEIFGKGNFYGTITLDNTGNMIVDEGADGSYFAELINKGTGLTIEREITIAELHNYGTMTVTNNNVSLDVYNHRDANIKFDLKYGTAVGGVYSFDFDRGEASGSGTGNRLINGGTITVNNGTVNLNNFTQGDKNAETGKWTYGGENFVVEKDGTLVFGATVAQINTGNTPAVGMGTDYYLGNITNAGTVKVAAAAGEIAFAGKVVNAADSKFFLANSETTFNGNFTHDGSLLSEGTGKNVTFSAGTVISGSGTIGGVDGYDGKVTYNGGTEDAPQQILAGVYKGTVTLAEGTKVVNGDIDFNGKVENAAVITGADSQIAFNGDTTGEGSFDSTLAVTYAQNSNKIYSGSYGDLVINSNNRTIAVDLTAEKLTLNGIVTFEGATRKESADVVVSKELILGENSQITFAEFSSLNADTDAAAVIKGGKNGGSLTFTTREIGDNVTIYENGLAAAVTYNYEGAGVQNILAGSYLNGLTLNGDSVKRVNGTVSVDGLLQSTDDAQLHIANGGTLEVVGTIQVDALKVDADGSLILALRGTGNRLGTTDDSVTTDDDTGRVTGYSDTGVVFGGSLKYSALTDDAKLTIYGWRDLGILGTINVSSGTLTFEATPAKYGYVGATFEVVEGKATVNYNERLAGNFWVIVSSDTRTSELTGYNFDKSFFRVVDGATLTVDYFALKDGADYVITDTVKAFSVEGGSTLFIELAGGFFNSNPAEITVENLYVDGSSRVEFSDSSVYTLNITNSVEINGIVAGKSNVNVNVADTGAVTGSGTFDMAGGKVTYAAGIQAFGGTYNDLELNGNKLLGSSVVVNGAAMLSGNITGNSKITFNGKTAGDATFGDASTTPVKAYNGLVTYSETSGAIYGGRYVALNIIGDHEVKKNLTIDLVEGGVFSLNSTLELASHVTLTILGSTDAAAEGNTGRIEAASSSHVIYGYNADIYGGTYGNLTAVGAETIIAGDLTVKGEADLTGIFLGEHDVTFKGATNGDAAFGVFGDDTKVFGGNVTYEAKAQNVYGGNYYDLTIDGSRTLGTSLQVNNSVTFVGDKVVMDAAAPVNFAFGANAALTSTDVTFDSEIKVQLFGGLNITDSSKVTFNGITDAASSVNGYILSAANATVTYNATADVYNGTYGNLNIVGDHVLLGQGTHPDTAAQGIVVNGAASLTGVMTGKAKVTFNGSTAGDATFGKIGVDSYNGTVTYGAAADTIFGGQYTSIDIAGDSSVSHTVAKDLRITVPGGGLFRLSSKLVLGENVVLTLDGLTDANDGATGTIEVIEGDTSSHVIYGGDAAIYGGTYGKLTLNGAAYELLNNFTVNSDAVINGSAFTGRAAVVFKGAVSGNAVFGNLDTESVYAGSVTYDNTSGAEQTVFSGYYGTLNIIGDHILDHQLRINAGANFEGVITERNSALAITFDNGAVLTGSGQFGQDAGNRYLGTVTYNGVTGDTGVFSGFYSTLKLSGNNETAAANINVDNMVLEGVLAVKGAASVELAGTTSGNGTFSATAADANTLVTYADTAELYGGSYGGLTFGSRDLVQDMTVYGTATLNGTMTGSAAMTFNGGIAGNATFGTAEDAPYTGKVTFAGVNSDIYGGFYNDLVINNAHTLTNAFVVVEGGQAFVNNAYLSGNAAVTFNGTTSGNGRFGGVSADNRYEGTVTYNRENAHILGGFYGGTKDAPGLVINSNGTIDAGIVVDSFSTALTGTLTVEGSIFFSDWTDAVAKGDAAKVLGTGSIGYGTTADIYGGAYANLVIYGDHHFLNSFTVDGTTTVYANDHGTESATKARLTGADGIDLVFKGIVTDEGAKIGLNSYFALLNDAAPASVTYGSAGDVLGGYYNLLNVNGVGTNTVQGNLTAGEVVLADDVTLSGTGDWTIGKNNADSSTAVVDKDSGTVTYNGLTDGETGAIYKGTYSGLKVMGGEYSVGDVTINGELSGDTTGKIIFNGFVKGSGSAVGVNADYYSEKTILGGTYNNLGINKESVFATPVTVNGALTALSDEARITGNGAANTLTLAGSLVGFENRNGIDYAGEIILSGAGNSFVISAEADNRNHIGTLTVGTGVSLELSYANIDTVLQTEDESSSTLTDVTVPAITGTGDVLLKANVAVDGFNMTGGTVTYGAEAQTTLVQGNYFNLKLDQLAAAVSVANVVTVNGTLDVNSHNINNSGDLTIYQFDNTLGTVLNNSGKLTFGSSKAFDEVGNPAVRSTWDGIIYNKGDIIINRSNYSIAAIIHDDEDSSNLGTVTITESAQSKADLSDVVTVGIYSVVGGTVVNLNANAYLHDVDNAYQFTNRGTLNIGGRAGENAASMHIVNLHLGKITVNDIEYTFGKDSVQLTNGGSVTVNGENGVVIFNEVTESGVAGVPVYSTRNNGSFVFDFASDSVNIKEGLLGDIRNSEGTLYFVSDKMKYYGEITNGSGTTSRGDMYVWADSIFVDTLTSTYGIVQIGDGIDAVDVNFLAAVKTGSFFQISNKAHVVFESTLAVVHEFTMESGSVAYFGDNVAIHSSAANEYFTIFLVKEGAEAKFYANVTNQNGYDALLLNGGSYSLVSTPVTYLSEYYSADKWYSEFRIEGHVTINGTLTNRAYGLGPDSGDNWDIENQAYVYVLSDGNVFGEIQNLGFAARFDMNGSNNQFNGTVTNTGKLVLNGTNDYNDIINTTQNISFTVAVTGSTRTYSNVNNGEVYVNEGATGSTFRRIENASGATFTVASNGSKGINLNFYGDVVNKGTLNLRASGYEFDGKLTNSGDVNILAAGFFDGRVENSGKINLDAENVYFNRIENTGLFTVNAAHNSFTGLFINSNILNINAGNLTFGSVDNSGHINLHDAKQIVFRNLNIGESSIIDIDRNSSLHLHKVTEAYEGNYDDENYSDRNYKGLNYTNDAKLGTIIVRGDQRDGLDEVHKTTDKSDTSHGLYFESTETISSRILYDTTSIEAAVWYNSKTELKYEDASWVIIRNGEKLTLNVVDDTKQYKVLNGGQLVVKETASGTRIQVSGGKLLFDNDDIALTITGLVEIRSGSTVVFDNNQALNFIRDVVNAGTITFNAGSKTTFNNGLANSGTVEAFTNINGDVTNTGTYVIKGKDLIVDSSLNNANGTLSVVGSAQLKSDIGGNIAVQKTGVLKVGISDITSNLTNSGTVAVGGSTVTFSGDILKGGTFSGNSASLVFTGDVKTGASGVFNGITSVEYAGTAASQNIILGTYNNLTLNGGLKVVDDGTVAVKGTFTNNNEVKITDDGELILNKAVAGTGAYSNAGTLTFGENASGTIAAVNNSGTVNADGTVNFANLNNSAKGTFNADGNIKAAGTNAGTIVVNGTLSAQGLSNSGDVKVNKAGTLTLNDNEVLKGNVDNAGKVIANADDAAFGSSFKNTGTLTVNGSNAAFKGNTNEGTVTLNGSNADLNGSLNKGIVALKNDNVSIQGLNNDGTVEIHTYNGMNLNQMDNRDGVIEFHVDATITDDITQGRVAVSGGKELTVKMDKVNGNYNANAGTLTFEAVSADAVSVNSDISVSRQGTLKLNSDVVFNGDIDHNGNINTQNNDLSFEGSTSGNGRVSGNSTNTVTYGLEADTIYEGEYANLVVKGAASIGENSDVTVNRTMQNDGSIAVDGLLTLNGATQGSGTMAGGNGEVVYNGNADEQSIYAGSYNDLTFGKDASGKIDANGDITISGDAVNKSRNGAELAITDGRVTYNGTGSQHVMAGSYDELAMAGSGLKLMEADMFNVNSFTSNGGTHSNMLLLVSADAPSMWTLNADYSSIHYSFVDYADSTNMIFLDGTNMTGGGNSGSWAVFNSAGGVGEMFPSLSNPNFQAIAPYMSTLTLEWGSTGRFDAFRRMPVSMAAIAAGDMSDLVTLNTFENYDMIDFDGEFFGNAHSIGLLDEESREVLDDAASAGNSDLKALLED